MTTPAKPAAKVATPAKSAPATPTAELIEVMDALTEYRAAKHIKRALMMVAFEEPALVVRVLAEIDKAIEKEKANKA